MIKQLDQTSRRERQHLYRLVYESQRYQRVELDQTEPNDEAFAKLVRNIIRYNLKDPKLTYYLFWQNKEIVGCILLRRLADNLTGHIDDLSVDPRFRRNGVGRELLKFGDQWAKERGLKKLKLSTQQTNAAALGAYRSAGFHEIPSEYIDLEKELS